MNDSHHHLTLQPGQLALSDLRAVWADHVPLSLAREAWEPVKASCALVEKITAKGDPAYGINTGFGILAKAHIPNDQLEALQRNLILSHCAG